MTNEIGTYVQRDSEWSFTSAPGLNAASRVVIIARRNVKVSLFHGAIGNFEHVAGGRGRCVRDPSRSVVNARYIGDVICGNAPLRLYAIGVSIDATNASTTNNVSTSRQNSLVLMLAWFNKLFGSRRSEFINGEMQREVESRFKIYYSKYFSFFL